MEPDPETPIPESFDDWLYDPPALPTGIELPGWAWWVIGVIAAAILIAALIRIRRYLRIPPFPADPHEATVEELTLLKARAETLPPAEFGTGLVSSINRYLHRRYGELAEFRTRDELFDPRVRPEGHPPLPPGVPERFSTQMANCEEMRFAGRTSTPKSRRLAAEAALSAVEEDAQ